VGGDQTLADRILSGVVDLYEMPKDLQAIVGRTPDRAAWVQAQADAFMRAQIEAHEHRKEAKKATP
jgi:hypothetical protein